MTGKPKASKGAKKKKSKGNQKKSASSSSKKGKKKKGSGLVRRSPQAERFLARSVQLKVWDYFKRDARRAVSVKELSSELGLNQDQTRLLRLFLKSQVKIGALEPRRRGRYVLVHQNSPLSGAEQPAKARFGWHFDWSDHNMRTNKEHATFTVHDMHSLRELEVESFPPGVEEFASNVAAQALDAEVSRRLDLRDAPLVTIDGADAKDFDDAVGVLEVTNSHIKVAVAIADVAHYVEEDSVLDLEAARRATSVYLPGICFPMLPEALSNGACSLRPDEDRLSLVAILTYTRDGRLTKSTLHEAIINSKARLTYDQVGALLDAIDESGHTPQVSEDDNTYGRAPAHADDLVLLAGLTAKLRSLRTKRGALDLDIPEPSFVFDEEGHLEDIQSYERNRAHFLIEELMLQANEAVAAFLLSHELPGIYRNHGWPDEQKLAELLDLMMGYGLSDPKMKAYANRAEESDDSFEKEHPKHLFSPQDFADMTKSFGDHPARRLFQQWLLRTMQQAVYAAENEGHFGLALEHYLHFTSPIRRYPDLCVHRVVKRYLQKSLRPKDKAAYQQAFEEISDYVSKRERRVMQVERESHSCFQALLMSEHVGEEADGTIASVTSFGCFVQLDNYFVDGLLHVRNLRGHFVYDEHTMSLVASRSGERFSIGDRLRIVIANTSPAKGQIDFELVERLPAHPTDESPNRSPSED